MRTIYKYPLEIVDRVQAVKMFMISSVRLVEAQDGALCLWVEVDTEAQPMERRFVVYGTGHPIPAEQYYVGSCQMPPFVWHVYELPFPIDPRDPHRWV